MERWSKRLAGVSSRKDASIFLKICGNVIGWSGCIENIGVLEV